MSSHLQAQASQRNRFSREGFSPIRHDDSDMAPNYESHDAAIDIPMQNIPLQQVRTNASSGGNGGLRNNSKTADFQPMSSGPDENEKHAFFRGRRAKPAATPVNGTGRVGYDGEEDTLTTMGKIYNKVFGFSIVTRYFLYVLPLGILIAVPIIVGAVVGGPPKIGGVPIVWLFTWIEIIWLSLWVSKIVAHFLPFVFQLFVGVVSSGVRKYSTVIRKLEIPLSLVGWAVTSLATFKPLMTQNPYNRSRPGSAPDWVNIVQKILGAAVACTLLYLAEKAIINLIQINYHRKQFNARIKDSKRQVYILGLLYDASRALFPAYCPEFAEEDYIIADQLQLAALGGKRKHGHKKTGSSTPMRLIQNVNRVGNKVTSAFGNVAHEITGREVFNPSAAHSIVVTALEKKRTSEALARRIWMSFVMEGREALFEEDILDVMGPQRKVEAEEAYWALDRDGNGDVSLEEMIMTVVEWSRERKAIANSMVDVAQAINVLDRLLCSIVLVAVVFIFIAFLNTNFVTTLATAGTALLSLSFVFATTAQEFLGSCIFLFVKHPFDIGDRVDIAGDPFTVEHISLLFTVFRRASGLKTGQLCQYPNVMLNSLALDNVSRSKSMTEQITLDVSFDTSFDDIQILKAQIHNFVTDKDNNRDFLPDPEVEVLGTSDMSKLQLKVEIKHKSNWSNETLRAARRSKFMCALVSALRAVPIYAPGGGGDAAGSAANPNYGVTISGSEAKEAAEAAALEREKARMFPLRKPSDAKDTLQPTFSNTSEKFNATAGMTAHDARIINELNARDPAASAAVHDDDDSTLGDGVRPSIDQQDLSDMKNMMRRASTRGKRRPGNSAELSRFQSANTAQQQPSVPTITEPEELDYMEYGYTQGYPDASSRTFGGEGRAPAYQPTGSPVGTPGPAVQNTGYQAPPQIPMQTVAGGGTFAPQMPRQVSNPYRAGAAAQGQDEDEERGVRPYTGV